MFLKEKWYEKHIQSLRQSNVFIKRHRAGPKAKINLGRAGRANSLLPYFLDYLLGKKDMDQVDTTHHPRIRDLIYIME